MKKKTYFVLLIVLIMIPFIGCDDSVSTMSPIDPPSWIIGTWSNSVTNPLITFQFTSDNVINTNSSLTVNFKELCNSIGDSVSQTSTDTEYTITLSSPSDGSGTYHFVKTSSSTLNYSISTSGITVGPVELYKQ
jgi:hypothetical protein